MNDHRIYIKIAQAAGLLELKDAPRVRAILRAVAEVIRDEEVPIDIEHWMGTKKHLSAETAKGLARIFEESCGEVTDDEVKAVLSAAPVAFGLKAQGHLPMITAMLVAGSSWSEIGSAIGWCSDTAYTHFAWLVGERGRFRAKYDEEHGWYVECGPRRPTKDRHRISHFMDQRLATRWAEVLNERWETST